MLISVWPDVACVSLSRMRNVPVTDFWPAGLRTRIAVQVRLDWTLSSSSSAARKLYSNRKASAVPKVSQKRVVIVSKSPP